jgi:phosphoribosylanthranilate isomerase
MGKITMLKNVNDGINYYKAYGIFDVSSEVEKLFISKGWAIKSSKKVEEVIEEEIEEIIDPVINDESLEIAENID